ncbi:hypothetical protein PWT90_01342 [Aphanocladium album]|nr:hypothetical protein PWT90_01342 [Aphanocladium album]
MRSTTIIATAAPFLPAAMAPDLGIVEYLSDHYCVRSIGKTNVTEANKPVRGVQNGATFATLHNERHCWNHFVISCLL